MQRFDGLYQRLTTDFVPADHDLRWVHKPRGFKRGQRTDHSRRWNQAASQGGQSQRNGATHASARAHHPQPDFFRGAFGHLGTRAFEKGPHLVGGVVIPRFAGRGDARLKDRDGFVEASVT